MDETPQNTSSHRATPLVDAVICAGVAIAAYSGWQVATQPVSYALIVLLLLTATAGWLALRLPSAEVSFSISDTFSTAAALVIGPAAGAFTAALDGLILSFGMQKSSRTARRVLFNAAAPAVGIWTASQVFFAVAGPQIVIDGPWRVPRLFALLAIFCLLNFGVSTGLVAAAVGLDARKSPVAIWKEHFLGLWLTHLGATFASMLMLVLSHDWQGGSMQPLEVLLLITPLPVILYVTFMHAVGRTQDQIEHLGGMNRVYVATIEALAQTIDAKDQVTHDHIRRVQDNSVRLARALGIDDEGEIQALKAASLLHDVGKISVPEHILNKPGRLTPSELEIMRRHAPVGADILSVIGFPYPVVPIVRHHHENWDGTGYPDGLAGEAIPIGARILMVVDCFDALTSDRPYRPRFETAAALQVLIDRKGTMYDPQVVDGFLTLHEAGLNEVPPPGRAPVADPHATPIVEAPVEQDPTPRDLAAFYSLGRELAVPGGVSDIGDAIWNALRAELGAVSCVLYVYDESGDALAPAFRAGVETLPPDARVSLGDRLSGWVAATRTPIVNSDARLDVDPDLRDESPLQSALAVPIGDGEQLGGVLAFYSDRQAAFTPAHQRMAEAAAALVAERVCAARAELVAVPAGVARNSTRVSRR
ncbi:MAG TPA: HD domain-containing phosphohydrolase [Vicinamibacterales bacterium]|nr:HD domain-containing phosphohydrolase [Vicinamibacterales bacterium]